MPSLHRRYYCRQGVLRGPPASRTIRYQPPSPCKPQTANRKKPQTARCKPHIVIVRRVPRPPSYSIFIMHRPTRAFSALILVNIYPPGSNSEGIASPIHSSDSRFRTHKNNSVTAPCPHLILHDISPIHYATLCFLWFLFQDVMLWQDVRIESKVHLDWWNTRTTKGRNKLVDGCLISYPNDLFQVRSYKIELLLWHVLQKAVLFRIVFSLTSFVLHIPSF